MDEKIFIPLYAEQINFLIRRCGSLVTRIYSHFTFEQSAFKKEFFIMDQVSRQNTNPNIEKDFYKLMNNSNFGYDCRNNVDNCLIIDEIIDEIEEVRYIRKYQNVFDPNLKKFISSKLLEQEINEDFDNKISELDTNSQFFSARKNSLEIERKKNNFMLFLL